MSITTINGHYGISTPIQRVDAPLDVDVERVCILDPADNLTKQINLTYQKIIATSLH